MPPQVQVSYTANYQDTEIGLITNIAAQAYQDFQGGGKTLDIVGKSLKKGFQNLVMVQSVWHLDPQI